MSLPINVVVAEDHLLVREGFKALLSKEQGIEITGEACDGLEAVALAEKLKPDVLLLDLRLPRLHGLDVVRQLRDQKKTKIIVVTMHADEPYIVEALKNGVRGFVLKESPPAELLEAIRTVAAGGEFLSSLIRDKALTASLRRLTSRPGDKDKEPSLTQRERSVLELAAEGRSNADIASHLFISRRTAEAHRANLMKKLGLKSQTDLVLYAVRKGIVAP